MSATFRGKRAIALACLAVAVAVVSVGAASAQTPPPPPPTTPPSTVAPKPVTKTVKVGDNYYKPKTLKITVGTTVKWDNEGRSLHNVVPNKGKRFGVARLAPGKKYRFTFDEPGKYKYYCSFHGAPNTGQWGTIVVSG